MSLSRIILIVLTLWGLAMVVPDLSRAVQPLGAFGMSVNNDGLIYDVKGPFPDEPSSPAWRAGIRIGDRIDIERMRCHFFEHAGCRTALAVLGGLQFVLPGQSVTFPLLATPTLPERQVTLIAAQRPANILVRAIIVLDQIAAILVIAAAAWLVWTRPGAMSWGFFLYVNWFNPGQSYTFYAILAQWPRVMFTQDIAGCIAQAAGYAGLLLFVIRVPDNETEARWRPLERMLPLIGLAFAVLLAASYGSVLGYATETVTRIGILLGLAVALAAVLILMARKRSQTPEDYQRVRWVLWGCLIGLPAFVVAELASWTTFFETSWGDFSPPEEIIGLLYLVNGILCLFVFEAVRRPRVVNVSIPLRRVTILGIMLSVPVLLLHGEMEELRGNLDLPAWAWLGVGAVLVFLISQLHESAVNLVDRYLNRDLDAAEGALGEAMVAARKPAELDRLLTTEPFRILKLTSAAAFRRHGAAFERAEGAPGWENCGTRKLGPDARLVAEAAAGAPFGIPETDGAGTDLPEGLSRPVLGVPAANPIRCFALSLYGPHISGTDLDANERAMLARLATRAAAIYAELENSELKSKVERLEGELLESRSGALSA